MRRARTTWRCCGLLTLLLSGCGPQPNQAPDEINIQFSTPPGGLEYIPPEPGTYDLPTIQAAADGNVVDADGTTHRLFDYMGDKYVLLSFIYTRCNNPRGCPLATKTLRQIESHLEADPGLAARTRLLSLSFDPDRDTPELMQKYAAQDYLDNNWNDRQWSLLTTGSRDNLQPILDGYGQYLVREIDENGEETGNFTHVLKVFLIDRERRVRNIYSSEYIDPVLAIHDLTTLMMQDSKPTPPR